MATYVPNPLPVTDNGGSLTVDAPVATPAFVRLSDGASAIATLPVSVAAALPAGANAIGKLAANSGVDIGDVDITSVIPGTAATNLGKAEDAVHASGDTGVMALAVRRDAIGALAANGDYIPITTSDLGGVWTSDEINLDRDSTTSITGAFASAQFNCRGLTTVTFVITGTWSGVIGCRGVTAADVSYPSIPFVSGNDVIINTTTNGRYIVNVAGYAYILIIFDAWVSGTAVINAEGSVGTNYSSATLLSGTSVIGGVFGDVASDAVDSGQPVKIGALARTTNPTPVANADRANLICDDIGRQVVIKDQVRDLVTDSNITIVNSVAETTLLAAGGATVLHDLKKLVLTNASATAVTVTLREATAGTVRAILDLGALGSNSALVLDWDVPMMQGTANNNWTIQLSSAVVTVHAYVQSVKNV